MLSQGAVCENSRGASRQKRCHIKHANAGDEKWLFSIKRLSGVASYCVALQSDVVNHKYALESAVANITEHGVLSMSKITLVMWGFSFLIPFALWRLLPTADCTNNQYRLKGWSQRYVRTSSCKLQMNVQSFFYQQFT